VETVVYQAKKEGRRPSEEQLRQGCAKLRLYCQRWDSLWIGPDGLLTMTLAANSRHPERKRVVCPAAIHRELIWDAHKQAHAGVQRVLVKLQLRWYWPRLGRDVWLRVRQCEICQASKHGRLPGEAGRRRLYAERPWQVMAVDLVGPMPLTPRGNSWILVLTDHFTRWTDALAISDASAPTVARVLDQHVFCYFGLPEQIHSDQGAQFQSQLMSDLCCLWGVNQSRTTPYHPEENGVVERNNRMLGDALRSLLFGRSQEEWDTVLPQVMRACRSTSHTSTGETPNLLMLGRETRVPDHLTYHVPEQDYSVHAYASELVEWMKVAHEILQEKQWQVRKEDSEEPPLYQVGDWVWMINYRRPRGQAAKLQPKFVGPYTVVEVMLNHTYKLERSGQVTIQNETCLKLYWASPDATGEAPRC